MTARKRTLELALSYLDRHMYTRFIFPIKAGAKFPPLLKDNLDGNCTNDPEQARQWEVKFPGCNWGLAHKKSRVMAVDVDTNPKKGKQGQATYDELDLIYGWPETETTTTPSGGFHKIYEGEHVFALGDNGIGLDIDSPNYTLIPGSTFDDGTAYAGNGADAVACPQWIYDTIKGSKAKNKARLVDAGDVVVELDKQSNIDLAIDFLKEDAEPAIQGSGGDFKTLKTAMYLKDVGISPALALDLLMEYYNPRCEPEWDRDGMERKVANAYAYSSLSKGGGKTAEADFDDDEPEIITVLGTAYDEDLDLWLPKTPADVASKVAAVRAEIAQRASAPPENRERMWKIKEVVAEWGYIKDLERFVLLDDSTMMWKPVTFDRAFAYLASGLKTKSFSDALLTKKSGTVPRFSRAVYKPGLAVNVSGDFNMYVQPDIEPAEGDVSWWDDHLEYLLPNPVDRNLMLNWLAWFVQNLAIKPKHAMLLQGTEQGTGKSFIVEMLARIIGRRNTANINQTDLHGDFNGWAARSKLLAIEELRAVDRTEVANKLHPLITQDIVSVNEKNLPRRDVENCFGIFAMSNHDAAITLDQTDRRYLVINTLASPRFGRGTEQSKAYYRRLYARLNEPDAVAAVAFMLRSRDIGDYDGASAAPLTAAKAAMIKSGQSDLEHFVDENASNYPFNMNLIRVDDVVEMLPARLQRTSRLHSSIVGLLKTRFSADEPVQCNLANGQKVRLYPIGARAPLMIRNTTPRALAALYEKNKADAKKGLIADEGLDADEEFIDAD